MNIWICPVCGEKLHVDGFSNWIACQKCKLHWRTDGFGKLDISTQRSYAMSPVINKDIPALLARVAELEAALRELLVLHTCIDDESGVVYCPWCEAYTNDLGPGPAGPVPHESDCPRQKAAALVQPEAERAAEPEAAVCPGDYCEDGCTKCPC